MSITNKSVQCKAQCHEIAVEKFPTVDTEASFSLTFNKNSKGILYNVGQALFNYNYLPKRVDRKQTVCSACLKYAGQLINVSVHDHSSSETNSDTSDTDGIDPHIGPQNKATSTTQITNDNRLKFAKELGVLAKLELKSFTENVDMLKRMDEMKMSTYEDMHKNFEGTIIHELLSSMLLQDNWNHHEEEKSRRIRLIVKATENICNALNQKHLSSLSLAENLLMYHYSGSKNVCNIFGRNGSGGTYWSVQKFEKTLSKVPPSFPKGDIIVVCDNNQVIGKTYRIRYAGTVPQSIMTGITVIRPVDQNNLQIELTFNNILPQPTPDKVIREYETFQLTMNSTHRKYRAQYIETRLSWILQKSTRIGGLFIDAISKDDIKNFQNEPESLNYSRVPSDISTVTFHDQECLMLNPNSEENVLKVLDHLSKISLGSRRKWVILVQDGLPFKIALNIIRYLRVCEVCGMESKLMDSHMNENHPHKATKTHSKLKFPNIVLRAGNGHYEINFVRSIFANFFDIFLVDIAYMLGYKTPRSIEFCKSAVDHHKSWQILQVAFESLTDELLVVYIKYCSENGIDPTQLDYFRWYRDIGILNANYKLAFDFTFSILHPLFLFRAGVRQCNSTVALIGREKCSSLFYGFNHPKYRDINAEDLFFVLSVPAEVRSLVNIQSVRITDSIHGEGVDFLQEYRNKMLKQVIPAEGVPTLEQWRKASIILHHMEQIKSSTLQRLQMTVEATKERTINLSREIFEARKLFRRGDYFDSTKSDLRTMSQKQDKLHVLFEDFLVLSERNRELFYKSFWKGKKANLYPICSQERLQMDDLPQFIKEIRKKIKMLPGSIQSFYLNEVKTREGIQDFQELNCIVDEEIIEWDARVQESQLPSFEV